MELYFNDKKYNLTHNLLFESFLNENDSDDTIKQNIDNLLKDDNKINELLKILNIKNDVSTSNQQNNDANNEQVINNLNAIEQAISSFKI